MEIHFARMTVFGVDHKEAHNFAFRICCFETRLDVNVLIDLLLLAGDSPVERRFSGKQFVLLLNPRLITTTDSGLVFEGVALWLSIRYYL